MDEKDSWRAFEPSVIQILIPIGSEIIAQNLRWGIQFTTKSSKFSQKI